MSLSFCNRDQSKAKGALLIQSLKRFSDHFKPTIHKEIYAFDDLPRAMHEMHLATQTGIPIVRVAKDLPEAVAKIA